MILSTTPNVQSEPINDIVKFSSIVAPPAFSLLITKDFYNQYWTPYLHSLAGTVFLDDKKVILQNIDELGRRSKVILGENGTGRYSKFEKYAPGWDGGDAKPLSYRSVAVMEYFFEQCNDFPTTPSIFLMESGNLQLGWEDKFHKTIEVEFAPDQLVYFIESLDVEGEVKMGSAELSEFFGKIKRLSV